MSTLKKTPSEGGSGGRRGHSNMEHWTYTREIKDAARSARRRGDNRSVKAGLQDADLPDKA